MRATDWRTSQSHCAHSTVFALRIHQQTASAIQFPNCDRCHIVLRHTASKHRSQRGGPVQQQHQSSAGRPSSPCSFRINCSDIQRGHNTDKLPMGARQSIAESSARSAQQQQQHSQSSTSGTNSAVTSAGGHATTATTSSHHHASHRQSLVVTFLKWLLFPLQLIIAASPARR